MVAIITLLYPAHADHTFDLDYYKTKHMPLVWSSWSPVGLKSYKVVKLETDGGYSTQCIMTWESTEAFKKARGEAETAGKVFGDIPNFSNYKPEVFVLGDVVDEKE